MANFTFLAADPSAEIISLWLSVSFGKCATLFKVFGIFLGDLNPHYYKLRTMSSRYYLNMILVKHVFFNVYIKKNKKNINT
jgi:hypothetical protein